MVSLRTVVKLGGSLLAGSDLPRLLNGIAAHAQGSMVVVPGGGSFADVVRSAQVAVGFDDRLAHRLALRAMGQMAQVFAAIDGRLQVAIGLAALQASASAGRVPVWDPADLEAGVPEIPESWSVTSDSLAIWLATALGAEQVLLVKSVDPTRGWSLVDLAECGIVDEASPAFAARFAGTIDVLGPNRWHELTEVESLNT